MSVVNLGGESRTSGILHGDWLLTAGPLCCWLAKVLESSAMRSCGIRGGFRRLGRSVCLSVHLWI